MKYSLEKKELSPQPVLLVRRRVKRSEIAVTIGEALPHVFEYAAQRGIALAGVPFTRYIEMGTPSGAPWESYLTDPGQHPDPKDWKTEVFWPIGD
jgi:hypothetical protein